MGEKAVLDTNVIISGFVGGGPPGEIIDLVLEGRLAMAISAEQLTELRRVLAYRRIGLSEDVQKVVLDTVLKMSTLTALREVPRVVSQDPTDDILMATAIASGSTHLITGDAHLLQLGAYKGVDILSPAAFIAGWRTRTHTD